MWGRQGTFGWITQPKPPDKAAGRLAKEGGLGCIRTEATEGMSDRRGMKCRVSIAWATALSGEVDPGRHIWINTRHTPTWETLAGLSSVTHHSQAYMKLGLEGIPGLG